MKKIGTKKQTLKLKKQTIKNLRLKTGIRAGVVPSSGCSMAAYC